MAIISSFPGKSKPKLQSKTATPSTSQQIITPDSAYDGLEKVTVGAMKLYSVSIIPLVNRYMSQGAPPGYDGLSKVDIEAGFYVAIVKPQSENSIQITYNPVVKGSSIIDFAAAIRLAPTSGTDFDIITGLCYDREMILSSGTNNNCRLAAMGGSNIGRDTIDVDVKTGKPYIVTLTTHMYKFDTSDDYLILVR